MSKTPLVFALLALAWASPAFAGPDAKEYFGRGEQLLSEKKWKEAAKQFEEAIELEKNYAEAWNRLGETLYNRGEIFEAVEKFKNALKINPRYTAALYNLGLGYENLHLEKRLYSPLSAIKIGTAGVTDRRFFQPDEKTIKKIAKTQHLQALEAYGKAIHVLPMNDERAVADSHFRMGALLRDLELKKEKKDQNFHDAILHLEAALGMFPDYPECRNELGRTYDIIGRYPSAIEQYTLAIEGHKYFAQAYSNRGVAWWHDGNWDNALADCRVAIEIDPKFAGGHYNFAEVVYAQVQTLSANGDTAVVHQEVEKAIDEYAVATKLDPYFKEAWLGLGKAYRAYHDYEKAKATYEKVLADDKRDKTAKQALKEIKAELKEYVNHIPKQYQSGDHKK